jgi:hypothetical protein
MRLKRVTSFATLSGTILLAYLLTACTNTSTQSDHQHDHDDSAIKQYNPKILNVYETDYTCPTNGKQFKALELGTHSTMGLHLDWQPISYMRFPVAIPVCPNGFIVDEADIKGTALAARKAYIESAEYQQLYKQKHASFFLFAKQSEALQENLDNLWWYYLQATWEADGCGDHKKYNQYAALVIEKASVQKAKLTEKDEEYWPMSIIIADMYRRTSQFEIAQQQLNAIGTPTFEEQKSNDFYLLAKKVMQQAIDNKNTKAVPIKEMTKKAE